MLNRKRFRLTVLGPATLLILWGCQTTTLLLPADLGPGNGRADRSYEEPVARVIPAVFKALDDHKISPMSVTFRNEKDGSAIDVEEADEARKNVLLLKDRNVLVDEEIELPDGKTKPFKVGQMLYTGFSVDGHRVVVTVKTQGEDTEVSTRVGRIGNRQRALALLDGVTGRLEADWKIPTPEPTKEKLPAFKRTLPSQD